MYGRHRISWHVRLVAPILKRSLRKTFFSFFHKKTKQNNDVSSVPCHLPCIAYLLSYVSQDCAYRGLLPGKLDGTTDKRQTDNKAKHIATFRLKQPRGWFSEKGIYQGNPCVVFVTVQVIIVNLNGIFVTYCLSFTYYTALRGAPPLNLDFAYL